MALKVNLNSLKGINWKELMLLHGDKIALCTTLTVGLGLLIWSLFLPGGGIWLVSSPSNNAEALNKEAGDLENKLNTAVPQGQPGMGDIPPEKKPLPDLAAYNIPDPAKYLVTGLFESRMPSDSTRGQPDIKLPDEGKATVVMGQIGGYNFTSDYQKLTLLKDAAGKDGKSGTDISAIAGRMTRGTAAQGRQQPMIPAHLLQRARELGLVPDDRKKYTPVQVPLTELANDASSYQTYKPATKIIPLRLAKIVASFPLEAQLEEFRTKLRLPSIQAVTNERLDIQDDDGHPLPAFRFLGVNLQRREVDVTGKPLKKENDGWEPVNLEEDYRHYFLLTGIRFQDDDKKLEPITLEDLVMPQLIQARETRPGQPMYPEIETKLKNIQKSLDDLAQAQAKAGSGSAVSTLVQEAGTRGVFTKGPKTGAPGNPPKNAGGILPKGPKNNPQGNIQNQTQEAPTPKHCLIRLFDVTIKPGTIYEYRIQVRMGNPNFHKAEQVADPRFAQGEELESDKWYVIPEKVRVPSEMEYYAVDQKDIDKTSYRGLNANARVTPGEQVCFQIQRWLERGPQDSDIGEWVVAERIVVNRGEYIGRPLRIEFPVWQFQYDAFVIPEETVGKQKVPGMEVNFADPRGESILIDFEGPKYEFKRGDKTIKEDIGNTEVLFLSSDGRLKFHETKTDANDKDRVDRLHEWRQRVKDVKENKNPDTTKKGGPF